MKKNLLTCLFALCMQYLFAQQDIQQRVILIGDAGEINTAQKAILSDAENRLVPGKTTAVFLGDNIYPSGFDLSGGKRTRAEAILRSQFAALRKRNISVYFVPGNHDWDRSGREGFEKITAAGNFIQSQQDPLLKIIPQNGCAGPYEIALGDSLVLVAMDSEWWLFPYDKHTDKSDCPAKTKTEVLRLLQDILNRNRNKMVIFATHHPFKTYGSHGGYYSLREHIFPLTDFNKNLYIPLPIIGSLYPVLRKTFPPAEDLGNAINKGMQQSADSVLQQHPNIIHVSGHEHTLQLIQGNVLQLVSGAGSKHTPVKKGRGSIFATASCGYAIADVLKNNTIRITFFTYKKGKIVQSFVYTKPFQLTAKTINEASKMEN